MPERTFPKPPILVQPVYRDMDAQLAGARQEWDRMHDRMRIAESVQPPAQTTAPFTPSVPIEVQPGHRSELDRALVYAVALVIVLALVAVVRALRQLVRRLTYPCDDLVRSGGLPSPPANVLALDRLAVTGHAGHVVI